MAVRIVVLLEEIEIGHQHRERVAQPARAAHFIVEHFHHAQPVVQTGQWIRDREALELGAALAELRHHVVEDFGQIADFSARRHRQADIEIAFGHPAGRFR